ncbi:MAG: hypothetical protein PVH88_23130 [Ignavibacteria bacterium]|jgi:hypothetical protein
MPLKKPQKVPKIPKARKKSVEDTINSIPAKKPDKIEYTCKALFMYNELTKTQQYVFAIETVAVFTSFAYEVSLDFFNEKDQIYIVIKGLKALPNLAPRVMPARTDIVFENLVGEYTVNVVKQDGAINSGVFKFNIYNKEIKLLKEFKPEKENNRYFCKFEVAENEYTFEDNLNV